MSLLADIATWRFWRHLIVRSLAAGGFLSACIQFAVVFIPQLSSSLVGPKPLLAACLLSIVAGLILSWPRPIECAYSAPKTRIKIIKGDLLSQTDHIAVGVCDTFDTETPNIISNNSLTGQMLNKLFGGDRLRLDGLIEKSLHNIQSVGRIVKLGKTDKYPVGTVVPITHDPRKIFLVAYCEMNEKNEAFGTPDNVWRGLLALWESLSAHGNQRPISVPVIGGGQARMSGVFPAQDSIRLIAMSFIFASRNHKVADELRIVVQPDAYDELDRLELQSFLSSLRSS